MNTLPTRKSTLVLLGIVAVWHPSLVAEENSPVIPDSALLNPVAVYSFDEEGRAEPNRTGRGREAVIISGSANTSLPFLDMVEEGIFGRAKLLGVRTGVQTHLKCGNPMTISLWVRQPEAGGGSGVPLQWQEGAGLFLRGNSLDFSGPAVTQSFTEKLEPGSWTHLAVVRRGEESLVYVNGKELGRAGCPSSDTTEIALFPDKIKGPKTIGAVVDEMRVYDAALSPEDVAKLASREFYASQPAPPEVDAGIAHTIWSDGGATVQLEGIVKGAGGLAWTTVAAPEGALAVIEQPDQAKTTVRLPSPGRYEFQLSATGNGMTRHSRTSVRVFPKHEARQAAVAQSPTDKQWPTGAVEPLAYWKFDQESGAATPSEIQGRQPISLKKPGHGIVEDPERGSVLSVEGSWKQSQLNLGNALDGKSSGTISCWVKPRGNMEKCDLFHDGKDWKFAIDRSLRWSINPPSLTPSFQLPAGEWGHLVISWDKTSSRVFWNGQQIYYNNVEVNPVAFSGDLLVGADSPQRSFLGSIDEMAIYDFQVHPDEARLLYEKGPEAFTARLPYEGDWIWGYSPEFKERFFPHIEHKTVAGYAKDGLQRDLAPYVHPRVYFGPEDLPEIRRRLKYTKSGQMAWKQLNNLLHSGVNLKFPGLLPYRDNPDSNALLFTAGKVKNQPKGDKVGPPRTQAGLLVLDAFRCLIENDEEGARWLAGIMMRQADLQEKEIAAQRDQRHNFQKTFHNIVGRRATALMYDLLYPWLTEAERTRIRSILAKSTANQWATGLDAVDGHKGTNWGCWMAGDLMLNLMAIEGEEGFDQETLQKCYDFYHRFLLTGFSPEDGSPDPGMAKHSFTGGKLLAMARRGHDLLGSEVVYRHVTEYLLHGKQPFENTFVVDDLHGGSRKPGSPAGDIAAVKYAFPDDPLVNYVYRMSVGDDYERMVTHGSVYGYTSVIMPVLLAQDWTGPEDPEEHAREALKDTPTARHFNFSNVVSARTGWGKDALFLWFWPRMLGGHPMPGRGTFVLSALGREWVWYPSTGPQTSSKNFSVVHVDGQGPGIQPGKILDYRHDDDVTLCASDLIAPYAGEKPDDLSNNWFRFRPDPLPWNEMPAGLKPQWFWGNFAANPFTSPQLRTEWRPGNFQTAFRTAALVRRPHPYVLIVDDFKKDSQSHQWTWQLALAPGLDTILLPDGQTLRLEGGDGSSSDPVAEEETDLPAPEEDGAGSGKKSPYKPTVAEARVDGPVADSCIVIDPHSDARLLVKVLRCAKTPAISLEQVGKSPARRLVFTTEGEDMDFAVMLYPFRERAALPAVSNTGDEYTITWPDATERLKLEPRQGAPTAVTWIERK